MSRDTDRSISVMTEDVGRLFIYASLGVAALLAGLLIFRPGRTTQVPESVLAAARNYKSSEELAPVEIVEVQRPILPETPVQLKTVPATRPHTQWDVGETAFDSLGRIGRAAVPTLVRTLQHDEPEHHASAARLLGRIGPDAEDAVSALMESLKDPNVAVRKASARALGEIGPAAARAVEPLLKLMVESSADASP